MGLLLLSRVTKDFLNLDCSQHSARERYRMGWSGSILSSHSKNKIHSGSPNLTQPTIPPPKPPSRPIQYFSKGMIEADRRHNPRPIPYLLTETNETAVARPVPGNSFLLRSICKGKGVLRQNNLGMIFLDVDNRFASTFMPFLKSKGLTSPSYFSLFNHNEPKGAHIPVIPAREVEFQYLNEIEELAQEFHFEIEGLYSMEPNAWPGVEQVWFFKLNSPELETFRRRHFLPATPGGHSFHIAVAIKARPTLSKASTDKPLLKINPGFSAA